MVYGGYRVEPMGTFPMYIIRAEGQGRVPDVLSGMYSSVPEAKKGIDAYNIKKEKPKAVKKRALKNETDDTSGD